MFDQKGSVMVIGVTDNLKPSFEDYVRWIQRSAPKAQIMKLSADTNTAADIVRCDGIVLTGGGDIHPRHYAREDAMGIVKGVNVARDEFEFQVVHEALKQEVPILGVCRGMQLFNVALGGSMIPDVQQVGCKDHSGGPLRQEGHGIRIARGSRLHSVIGEDLVEVNTSHHQAVERIGRDLRAVAWSEDGLVEGLEWMNPDRRPFILLVQWHPERMMDGDSAASLGILDEFVKQMARVVRQSS